MLVVFSYSNGPPMSPMTMLRQSPTDPRWFEENVNDFSLSSFLGQLDAAVASDAQAANADAATASTLKAASGEDGDEDSIETPRKSPLTGGQSSGIGGGCGNSSTISPIPPLESSRMSTLSESSIDYMSKFEEIAQSMLQKQREQELGD